MNELALFAGGGGGLLASKWLLGWRTVCYVERERHPVEIIKARIKDGLLDDAPIWDDARTFDGRPWRGFVDIVTAGFPCQPFSAAGKRQSDTDERNGWPDTIRIIREVRPHWCFLENVPGLLSAVGSDGSKYFGTILRDLAQSGYDARWRVLSASEMGANHKRKRLWIVAHTSGAGLAQREGERGHDEPQQQTVKRDGVLAGEVAHAEPVRRQRQHKSQEQAGRGRTQGKPWWQAEPDVGRVVDGVAHRVDRIKVLGNGQVPLVAATAWRLLTDDY